MSQVFKRLSRSEFEFLIGVTLQMMKDFSLSLDIQKTDTEVIITPQNNDNMLFIIGETLSYMIPDIPNANHTEIVWSRDTNGFTISNSMNARMVFTLRDQHPLLFAFRRLSLAIDMAREQAADKLPAVFTYRQAEEILGAWFGQKPEEDPR